MKCSKCGAYMDDNIMFCTNCGNRMSQDVKPPKKRQGSAVYVMLAVTMALLIAVLFWHFSDGFGTGSGGTVTPQPTQSTVPATPSGGGGESKETTSPAPTATVVPTAESGTINVENEVKKIRALYDEIETDCVKGRVSIMEHNGAQIYDNSKGMMKAVAPSGANGIPYEQNYYFKSGKLIFAYYEAEDAYRFYFSGNLYNEQMIRMRYCADSDDYANEVVHDMENTEEYNYWEKTVHDAAMHYAFW